MVKQNKTVLGVIGVILTIFGVIGSIASLLNEMYSSWLYLSGTLVIIGVIAMAWAFSN